MIDLFRPVRLDEVPAERFPRLDGDQQADVAVVGAGIERAAVKPKPERRQPGSECDGGEIVDT